MRTVTAAKQTRKNLIRGRFRYPTVRAQYQKKYFNDMLWQKNNSNGDRKSLPLLRVV